MTILLQSTPLTAGATKGNTQSATTSKTHSQSGTAGNAAEKQLRDKKVIDITSGDLWILLAIALVAGCLGGWYNFRRTKPSKQQGDTNPANNGNDQLNTDAGWGYLETCLLGGVIACALIPLFLQTIQSQLLNQPTLGDFTVFAGLCLIAAISSNAFIDTLTKRVLDQINVKADAALQKATDANTSATAANKTATDAHHKAQAASSNATMALSTAQTNSDIIKPIIKTLTDVPIEEPKINQPPANKLVPEDELSDMIKKPNLIFRSVDSVVKESGQPESTVQAAFDELEAQNKVKLVNVGDSSNVYLLKP